MGKKKFEKKNARHDPRWRILMVNESEHMDYECISFGVELEGLVGGTTCNALVDISLYPPPCDWARYNTFNTRCGEIFRVYVTYRTYPTYVYVYVFVYTKREPKSYQRRILFWLT